MEKMDIEENSFKDMIIPKIQKATTSLTSNNHPRILLCDFSSIQKKKLGDNYLFYNKTYKNVSNNNFYLNIFFNKKETIRIFQ